MAIRVIALVLLIFLVAPCKAQNASQLLNLLFTGDIGHSREHADRLTHPWPMDKSADEGAFSLYEGLYDYVTRQGAQPSAVVVLGDIAYGGGNSTVTEDTRAAFQKYLAGMVPEDRVFVSIGNHDVHYLGCTDINTGTCYYGSSTEDHWRAKWNMSFQQWRSNWLRSFPGLVSSFISPPSNFLQRDKAWIAPLRYNLNLEQASSVYLIVGLNSGCKSLHWNGDTPLEATDAKLEAGIECAFLRDSLAHGRSLGKTVFIYATHHFNDACNDWSLLRQIDVWMYGHKHNYWQSALKNEVIVQEKRHYPTRLLIGNGGFDEGYIDVVSFGHLTEHVVPGSEERVRLNFTIFDTCISNESSCPDSHIRYRAACWRKCKDFPGGFDNGGGPRKATPSRHAFGFQFEAPRKPAHYPEPQAPFNGTWKLQVTKNGTKIKDKEYVWLTLGLCPWELKRGDMCIRPTQDESAAISLDFYDARQDDDGKVSVRVAVDDDVRAPLMSASPSADALLYRPGLGFWTDVDEGHGYIHPSGGHLLEFMLVSGSWRLLNVAWESERKHVFSSDALSVDPGSFLGVAFKPSSSLPEILAV